MIEKYNNRSILIHIFILFLIVFSAEFSFAATTTLNWNPPTENEDGSTLNDLDGYIIYYGTSSDTYTQSIDVSNVTTYQLSGLEYDTTYYIAITAYDTSGNESTYSEEQISHVGPAPDSTPPNITNVLISGMTETSATISWTTDEAADTKVEYGTTSSYGSTTTLNSSSVTSHSQSISGLSASTLYHYKVLSRDDAGNLATSSGYTFTTTDNTAPVISSVQAAAITESSVTISWTTNEASDTKIWYGTTTSYGSSTTLNSSDVTSHSQSISGLSASTLYHYKVLSRDSAGNRTISSDYTFTTTEAPVFDYYCDSDNDSYFASSVSGTCTGTGCVPAECQTTAGNDCNEGNISINPGASDDNCNGIDENCSGTADNDYVITITSCGTGVCSSVGQIECQDGSEVNSCTPGTPTESDEATCDDLDNDCDGQVDEGCAPVIKVSKVILSEDFSEGIPDTWSNQGNWTTSKECKQVIKYPLVKPAAIVDSSCSATSDEVLITDSFETSSCSSVELEFTNQYYWYSGNFQIDVSDDGGQHWTNNLYIDSDDGYPSPEWKNVDISSAADSSNAQVRFRYTNSSSDGFWAIDNVWVTCQSPEVEFTGTVGISTTRTIMITNSGNENLTVADLTISGANAADFIVNGNDNCTGQTLEPTKTCTFDIDFSSSTLGPRTAIISITSDDPVNPTSTLTLTGTVLEQPVLKIMVNGSSEPADISYGDNLAVTIELDPKHFKDKKADWWVLYEYRNRFYYYSDSNGKWRRGSSYYKQDTLTAMEPTTVKNDSRSPKGAYKYYFGFDINMNGSRDTNLYFEDSITVNVK
jgi:hypothetical protein